MPNMLATTDSPSAIAQMQVTNWPRPVATRMIGIAAPVPGTYPTSARPRAIAPGGTG
jgi:hypothetical protein